MVMSVKEQSDGLPGLWVEEDGVKLGGGGLTLRLLGRRESVEIVSQVSGRPGARER